MQFYVPTRLLSGPGCVTEERKRMRELGGRCLIVCGATSAKKSGALQDAEAALQAEHIEYTVFDGIKPNPTVDSCREAGKVGAAFGARFVLGIGGGSPLDAAKAAAVFCTNPDLTEDDFYARRWPREPLPIALIGTTAGTGSEATSVSVLTDSHARKHSIHDDALYACVSYGDPRYIAAMPRNVLLSTGIDAAAHCLESYFSHKSDATSRACAVHGLRLLWPALNKAVRGEALTEAAYAALYEASLLGGMAISRTGTCFPHNVGYLLTEERGVPHGFACAMLLPEMLRLMQERVPEAAAALQTESGTGCAEWSRLIETLPLPQISFTAAEIQAALPRWTDNRSVKNTLGNITVTDIERALQPWQDGGASDPKEE